MLLKTPPYDPEDGGVPPDMCDGEINDEGWVKWKQIPSKINESDIYSLFIDFSVKPPRSLVEYLKTDYHLINQINNGDMMVMLPDIPSDNPLGPMRSELDEWKPLIPLGYIPIGQMEDGWGPICFSSTDSSIVWFDHEALFNVGIDNLNEKINALKKPLYSDIDSFYKDVLTIKESSYRDRDAHY